MRNSRNILFFAMTSLFVITAPLVIMYTAGFRYDAKKGAMERVGMLETSTSPSGAQVTFNGRAVGKTPYVDTNVLPGTYDVLFTKEAFHTLAMRVTIRRGLSTLLINRLLWRQSSPELLQETATEPSISPNGKAIAYQNVAGKAVMQDIVSGKTREVCASRKNAVVSWNSDGTLALWKAPATGTQRGITICTGGIESLPKEPVSVANTILDANWSSDQKNELLLTTPTSTITMNVVEGTASTEPAANQTVLTRGSRTYRITGTPAAPLLSETSASGLVPLGKVNLPAGTYEFLDTPDRYLALHDRARQTILLFRTNYLRLISRFSGDRLIFNPTEPSGTFAILNDLEVDVFDPGRDALTIITRYSTPILALAWHPSGNALLIAGDTTIVAQPLSRDGEPAITLAENLAAAQLWVDTKAETLLVSGSDGTKTGLWRLLLK